MMLVASLLLFLNLRVSYDPGWPLKLYPEYSYLQRFFSAGPASASYNTPITPLPEPTFFENVRLKPLLLDIFIAIALLTFTAVLSEFLFRRTPQSHPLKRIHPVAFVLLFTLTITIAWLNVHGWAGVSFADSLTPHVNKGWPFVFWAFDSDEDLSFQFLPLALSFLSCAALVALPAYSLHRLLRRTLHVHLQTVVLLMLVAAALLFLNLKIRTDDWLTPTQLQGWPYTNFAAGEDDTVWYLHGLVANFLITMAILSSVLLLSEFLLLRRNPSE